MKTGKPQKYDDDFYIQLINAYYLQKCNGNVNNLKVTKLAQYAQNLGYNNLKEYDIRRNKVASDYLIELKQNGIRKNDDIRAVCYITLNPEDFIHKNNTPNKLKKALMHMDEQNKIKYDQLISILNNNEQLQKKLNIILLDMDNLKSEVNELILKLSDSLQTNTKLMQENNYLHSTLSTYLSQDLYYEIIDKHNISKDKLRNDGLLNSIYQIINNISKLVNKSNTDLPNNMIDDFEDFLDQLESEGASL